jgi:hypothetical protein
MSGKMDADLKQQDIQPLQTLKGCVSGEGKTHGRDHNNLIYVRTKAETELKKSGTDYMPHPQTQR